MINLSANKHVKQLCMRLCDNNVRHAVNLRRIEDKIQHRYIAQNIPINWNNVQVDCNELVRIYIEHYLGTHVVPRSCFGLRDKVGMAANMLEYFKTKHGAAIGKDGSDYIFDLLDKLGNQ